MMLPFLTVSSCYLFCG